jgi:hypothetical protein
VHDRIARRIGFDDVWRTAERTGIRKKHGESRSAQISRRRECEVAGACDAAISV